ncbi:DUF1648 domain-containing protein [Olsenella profusa]|uniref:DUF1648 domain-containing protein n=1 Tax=Olsenella profusa TaxID=138595 RepID=A0ABS2F0A2_9ACTN|nr:DUF1648 domain-containing protein [Olsenella profusa]MBM6774253.1 DUF1648 domain-containing protein [Olsenella profusa]
MSERSQRLVTTVWVALTCVIGVGPTVLLAVAWPSVPETVPAHWGVSLEPDRWG